MHKRTYIDGHEGHPHYIDDKAFKCLKDSTTNLTSYQDYICILKTLSDPTRLSIYLLLHNVDEIPVSDICEILELTSSSVSHALADLKKLDLVVSSKCGQLRCYALKVQSQERQKLLSIFKKVFN